MMHDDDDDDDDDDDSENVENCDSWHFIHCA
jgi:hypothetical protein